MCILKDGDSNDISVKIQHTLIEAYCWENDITVLKIKQEDKINSVLDGIVNNWSKNLDDQTCMLVMAHKQEIDIGIAMKEDPWMKADLLLPG